ncbi:MAG: anhydro-N-acetylmuramic acid kinase [Bryobacteraceae bacterium]
MIVAGVMSGTSLDGIDVAIVDFTRGAWKLLAFRTAAYPSRVREAVLAVSNTRAHTGEVARLHFLLAELYAEAVLAAAKSAGARPQLIGCHGQTIFHEGAPVSYLGRRIASTLQIGDGSVLAERTGIPVISDFRPRDIAAGGRGAPLVPFVDYRLFRHQSNGRIALNIGGIANITVIPAGARPDQVIAFDTGPGNMVIDALVRHTSGGRRTFDRGGGIAARGRPSASLLRRLLADPYYSAPPPKTAGREQYGAAFVRRLLRLRLSMEDLIATATLLTASTIWIAVERFAGALLGERCEVIVSGGGVRNPQIMNHLRAMLPARVAASSEYGIDVDAKEAIAFAVLAYESWHGRPSNLPAATGARRAVVLGKRC